MFFANIAFSVMKTNSDAQGYQTPITLEPTWTPKPSTKAIENQSKKLCRKSIGLLFKNIKKIEPKWTRIVPKWHQKPK